MNRVAVWILGTISGLILFFGIVAFGLFGIGYGATSGCSSPGDNPAPCTPVLYQVVITNPLPNGRLPAGLLVILLAVLIGLPAWIGGTILAERRGSSSRTAILIVSIIASALVIVGLVSVLLVSPALATPETCIDSTAPSAICFYGTEAKLVAVFGIGFQTVLASQLIGMPAWAMALTETARHKRWAWFAAVLLLSPFAAMFYGFLGGQRRPPAAPATTAVATSGA